jgi:uncharacterized LabA/DUF88 family protein
MGGKENNYAFIDSQNLNLAILDQGWKLDFGRFRTYLTDRFSVKKAFLFIGYVATNEDLYTALQMQGFVLIFKPTLALNKDKGVRIKGNVDAELVLHAMIELPNYDKAVIVSGDGDFQCLVKHLRAINKLKKLIIPNQDKYSSLLRRFLPKDAVFMNGLRNKLEYKKR